MTQQPCPACKRPQPPGAFSRALRTLGLGLWFVSTPAVFLLWFALGVVSYLVGFGPLLVVYMVSGDGCTYLPHEYLNRYLGAVWEGWSDLGPRL